MKAASHEADEENRGLGDDLVLTLDLTPETWGLGHVSYPHVA